MAITTKWTGFEEITNNMGDALSLLKRTKELDLEYGRQEQIRSERFEDLESALKSREIKIVVIGEFSRGKSMLLNALMGIELLPTALKQTTAVNAFVRKVEDHESPYIKIIFQDSGRKPEFLSFDKHAIERWGTELDKQNIDARQEVEKIEIYTDHPIFKNDVILIDTPGFRGLIPLHEEIASRAINESHVAIWVQATDQLGGNAEEWDFLKNRIVNNFNKFITVVNKWDRIHEEARKENIPLEEYSISQIGIVRENFIKTCRELLTAEQINLLTNDKNLMGVSALWGLSEDSYEQEISNIQRLANRIQEMCATGEAQEEILFKPLNTLIKIQKNLKEDIEREVKDFADSPDLKKLKDEEEKILFEKERLELDRRKTEEESRYEHRVHADRYAKDIQEKLVEPLKELKSELEYHVTEAYVKNQVEKGAKRIELPAAVKADYERVTQQIQDRWESTKGELLIALQDLRSEFKQSMSHISERLENTFGELNFSMPRLNINMDIDLNSIEVYQGQIIQMTVDIERLEDEIDHIQEEKEKRDLHIEIVERRQIETEQRLRSLQKQKENLGAPPSPIKHVKQRVEKGIWKNTPYSEEITDDRNVHEWRSRKEEFENLEKNKEKEIERIMAEMQAKKGERISDEFAKKKLAKEMKKKSKEIEKLKGKFQNESETKVSEIYNRMKKETVYHVERMVRTLEKQTISAIEKLFEDQLTALIECVQEQYADRIETRLKQLESIKQRIDEGEEAMERRRGELKNFLKNLDELMIDTRDLYSRAKNGDPHFSYSQMESKGEGL